VKFISFLPPALVQLTQLSSQYQLRHHSQPHQGQHPHHLPCRPPTPRSLRLLPRRRRTRTRRRRRRQHRRRGIHQRRRRRRRRRITRQQTSICRHYRLRSLITRARQRIILCSALRLDGFPRRIRNAGTIRNADVRIPKPSLAERPVDVSRVVFLHALAGAIVRGAGQKVGKQRHDAVYLGSGPCPARVEQLEFCGVLVA